jgi:hypothetical protein
VLAGECSQQRRGENVSDFRVRFGVHNKAHTAHGARAQVGILGIFASFLEGPLHVAEYLRQNILCALNLLNFSIHFSYYL